MTTELISAPIPASIDGLEFVMTSSTGSEVADAPTRFRYQQDGQMVWGAYRGDTVNVGRFVGRRDGDQITISFAHRLTDSDEIVLGTASSELRRTEEGTLHLFETFEKNGEPQTSICIEAESTGGWDAALPASEGSPSVNGLVFDLSTTTASVVGETPTRFEFFEAAGITWGRYFGDTVTTGHVAGRYRDGVIDEFFVHHVVASDATLLGESSTRVQTREDGRLELVEDFVLDGVPGYSVCVQVN
ncbi:hypothetical protein [Glaciibacter psychrotolerans]|uniref:Uncharacterized protein n=1 Tax=Glaciibacter psychrotolerans TaxID=670054 RepID=A0A7Z0EDA9_9MICO|nr:hypothetical protein [Leifsonia psychrotolerans]